MDSKRFVLATLVGGIVLWVTGYLIFNVALAGFYAANVGSATGVDRTEHIMWADAAASIAYAALVVFALGRRGAAVSISEGAKIGAIVGFLLWATVDFAFYGSTNIANLTRTVADPLVEIVHGGIGGAAIAMVLGRVPVTVTAPA